MRLQHITFTGIDGKTDLGVLWELQQEFPMVEWGVLVAKNWRDNGNRYFNPTYLSALRDRGLNLSCHLCGSIARAAVNDNWQPFREWTNYECYDIFNRCQINIADSKENPELFRFKDFDDEVLFDEVIIQQRSADDCDLFLNSQKPNVSVLLDASGGQGIDTPIKVLKADKVGYAGGIGINNVKDKLEYLYANVDGDFWIDMETGVRTDDWFDIDKVYKVLRICKPIIEKY